MVGSRSAVLDVIGAQHEWSPAKMLHGEKSAVKSEWTRIHLHVTGCNVRKDICRLFETAAYLDLKTGTYTNPSSDS